MLRCGELNCGRRKIRGKDFAYIHKMSFSYMYVNRIVDFYSYIQYTIHDKVFV